MWIIIIFMVLPLSSCGGAAQRVQRSSEATARPQVQEISVRLISDYSVYVRHGRYAWQVRDYLLSLLNMSEEVFRSFDFEPGQVFGHRVCALKIHRLPGSAPYNQNVSHWDVLDLLYQVSVVEDNRDYALNILFTYIPIYDWKTKSYYEGVAPTGEKAGLFTKDNTIIISLRGLKELQIKRVLLHEIAHLYFLDHLDDRKVADKLVDGNFIMSPRLEKLGPNNLRFHSTSIEQLKDTMQFNKELNYYLDDGTCYSCGNGIPQKGEQCDDALDIPFEEFNNLEEIYKGNCDDQCKLVPTTMMIMDGTTDKERRTLPSNSTPTSTTTMPTLQRIVAIAPMINTRVAPRSKVSSHKQKPPINEVIEFLPTQLSQLDPIWKKQLDKWKSQVIPSFRSSKEAIKAVLEHQQVQREKDRLKHYIDTVPQRLDKVRHQIRQPIEDIKTNVNAHINKLRSLLGRLFKG